MSAVASASHRLSILGERLGVHALTYNAGVMRAYDWFARQDAPGFADRLITTFGPVRYLDVGAGTGRFAEALRARGALADACEYSRTGRMLARGRGQRMGRFDLARDPAGPGADLYDVALCLEVAEHVPAPLGDRLVAYLATFPAVVFTAAPPGQGGTGHVNEQPQDYWQRRFAAHGKQRQSELEHRLAAAMGDIPHGWLLANLMIYSSHARPLVPQR